MSTRLITSGTLTARPARLAAAALILSLVGACDTNSLPTDTGAPATPIAVERVEMSGAAWILEQGSAAYNATVVGTDGSILLDRPVSWGSSDTSIATVSSGVVYARRPGEVTLSAAAGGRAASMRLVVRSLTVDSVTVLPLSQDLYVGETGWPGIELRAADGRPLYDRVVTWASLDPSIATIDSLGRIRGVNAGVVYIVATSEGRSGTGRVVVKPSRVTGAWSIHVSGLKNANTECTVTKFAVALTQADTQLTGGSFYDMFTGNTALVECSPIAGQPGPYTTPLTPIGPFTGTIASNGYATLTSANGWQFTGVIDRAAGTWSGSVVYREGEPVNGVVPIRVGSFTARR